MGNANHCLKKTNIKISDLCDNCLNEYLKRYTRTIDSLKPQQKERFLKVMQTLNINKDLFYKEEKSQTLFFNVNYFKNT